MFGTRTLLATPVQAFLALLPQIPAGVRSWRFCISNCFSPGLDIGLFAYWLSVPAKQYPQNRNKHTPRNRRNTVWRVSYIRVVMPCNQRQRQRSVYLGHCLKKIPVLPCGREPCNIMQQDRNRATKVCVFRLEPQHGPPRDSVILEQRHDNTSIARRPTSKSSLVIAVAYRHTLPGPHWQATRDTESKTRQKSNLHAPSAQVVGLATTQQKRHEHMLHLQTKHNGTPSRITTVLCDPVVNPHLLLVPAPGRCLHIPRLHPRHLDHCHRPRPRCHRSQASCRSRRCRLPAASDSHRGKTYCSDISQQTGGTPPPHSSSHTSFDVETTGRASKDCCSWERCSQ